MEAFVTSVLRKHYSRIALACLVFLLASTTAEIVAVIVAELAAPELVLKGWFLSALSFVCMYMVGFPLYLVVLPKAPPQLPEQQPLGGIGEFLICLLMAMGILYPLNLLGQWVTGHLSGLMGGSGGNPLENYLEGMDLWAVAVFAVVLGPIMEELVFRKLMMDRMRTIDRPSAILFSALAFGLFHGNFNQFFYAFGVGILFGCIYARTGRLRYTIFLHILVNAIGSLIPMLILGDAEEPDLGELLSQGLEALPKIYGDLPAILGTLAFELLLLCCTVAGIVFLILRFPRLWQRRPEDRLRRMGYAFRVQYLNLGFILLFLACLGEMAVSLLIA